MKLTLETITPVHIGSGEVLSVYSDYIYKEGIVYYINQKKLGEDLTKMPDSTRIMSDFVKLVGTNADDPYSKYTLRDFFDDHKLNLEDYSYKKVETSADIKNEQIKRMITSRERPFIPGSTLKGAIRTGLLYNHMVSEGYDFNQIKKITDYIGQDRFGRYDRDVFKYLQVSDTDTVEPELIRIVKTVRWNLAKHKESVKVIYEVIPEGVKFGFELKSKLNSASTYITENRKSTNQHYQKVSKDTPYFFHGNERIALSKVNDFTLKNLNEEIRFLKQKESNDVHNIMQFYQYLKKESEELKESGQGAIMRIGAGKTFLENTVHLALKLQDRKMILRGLKVQSDPTEYPKTRSFISEGNRFLSVLGWVRIKMKSMGDSNDERK